jgi:hypothetical protein
MMRIGFCKAYYDHAPDKKKALYELLHIGNMKTFYESASVDEWFREHFQKM